jgi:hypothetical protein
MLIIYLMVEIEGARQGTKLGFFVLQLPAGQLSPLNYNFRRQARVFWPIWGGFFQDKFLSLKLYFVLVIPYLVGGTYLFNIY